MFYLTVQFSNSTLFLIPGSSSSSRNNNINININIDLMANLCSSNKQAQQTSTFKAVYSFKLAVIKSHNVSYSINVGLKQHEGD